MKTSIKNIKNLFAGFFVLVAWALLLSACSDTAIDDGESSIITINLGGEAAKVATGFGGTVDSSKLSYVVQFTNTSDPTNIISATSVTPGSSSSSISVRVPYGEWDISIEAFYNGWPYAATVETAYQVPGGLNPVPVMMARLPNAIALDHPKGQPIVLANYTAVLGFLISPDIKVYNFTNSTSAAASVSVSGTNATDFASSNITGSMVQDDVSTPAELHISFNVNTPGTYDAVLNITGTGGFSATIPVSVTVQALTWARLKDYIEGATAPMAITLPTTTLSADMTINVTEDISLVGGLGASPVLVRSAAFTGSFFNVSGAGKLTLAGGGGSVVLNGSGTTATASIVNVGSGADLEMFSNATIQGNNRSGGNGGAVSVSGTFTMNGGTITGNNADSGGGVFVASGGTLTGGGTSGISSNTSISALPPDVAYAVGAYGPGGGKVFYMVPAGFTLAGSYGTANYLEAAPAADVGNDTWGTFGSVSTGNSIGDGRNNTSILTGNAATACSIYSNNSLSDWFLPSLNELECLLDYCVNIEPGYLSIGRYWSSSNYDAGQAFRVELFSSSWFSDYAAKATSFFFCPIRAF